MWQSLRPLWIIGGREKTIVVELRGVNALGKGLQLVMGMFENTDVASLWFLG